MDGNRGISIQYVTTKDQLWFLCKLVNLFLVDLLIKIGQQLHCTVSRLVLNRWEICLRMRYNLRGFREKRLGAIKYSNLIFERFIGVFGHVFSANQKMLIYCIIGKARKV